MKPEMLYAIFGAVLINIFKEQLADFFSDMMMYWTRRYDSDDNPATGQFCMCQSNATGEWAKVYVENYVFSIRPSKRLIYVWFPYKKDGLYICSPKTYKQWRKEYTTGGLPTTLNT